MALLGLRCCVGFSLWWLLLLQSTGSGAPGLQWLWHVGSATSELHVACSWSYQSLEHKLSSCGEVHRLSCSWTCGIFLDQGWNLFLLHCRWILYQWTTRKAPLGHILNVILLHLHLQEELFGDWIRALLQRRQWHPTPVLLPGKSCGWRSLVGWSLWGR